MKWARYVLVGLGMAGVSGAWMLRDVLGVARWFL